MDTAFLVTIFCAFIVYSNAQSECPAGASDTLPVRSFGSYCYQFHLMESRGFSSAQTSCRLEGGNIVSIKNQEIQEFIYNTLRHEFNVHDDVWIGANDMNDEGHFVWLDGTGATYTNWAFGHPLPLLGSLEDCAVMDMDDGKWKNSNCEGFLIFSSSYPFVCEYRLVGK